MRNSFDVVWEVSMREERGVDGEDVSDRWIVIDVMVVCYRRDEE